MQLDWRHGVNDDVFAQKKYLVIDDIARSRDILRQTIQNMGGELVMNAVSYNDAIYRLREVGMEKPDIILCDYYLGDGFDGQNLFEEIVERNLIPESTIFMMVTAEAAYEQVASIVELAPDDYILKPFKPEALKVRLSRLILKKHFFSKFYQLKAAGRFDEALLLLNELQQSEAGKPYRIDIRRYMAESWHATQHYDRAEQAFGDIAVEHNPPWAKAGLAKAKIANNKVDEAELILDDIVRDHPNYLAARDMKSAILLAKRCHKEAKAFVQETLKITPRSKARRRELAEIAVADGDLVLAQEIAQSLKSEIMGRPNYALASEILKDMRMLLLAGNKSDALLVAEKNKGVTFENEERIALTALKVLAGRGGMDDVSEATTRFLTMRRLLEDTTFELPDCGADVVSAALHLEQPDLATLISRSMLHHRPRAAYTHLVKAWTQQGQRDQFRKIQRAIAEELIRAR